MAGFDRFNKVWSDTGIKLSPSDAQASTGFTFLGPTPPKLDLFNGINSDLDEKDNWLYNQIAAVIGAPPTDVPNTQLKDALDNSYVNITGDVMTGTLSVANMLGIGASFGNNSTLNMNRNSGFPAEIVIYTDNIRRWAFLLATSEPEIGGNSGSDFSLGRYDDGGIAIGAPFRISRATGVVEISEALEVSPTLAMNGTILTCPNTDACYKLTGGAWISATSDARVKQNIVDYTLGLDAIVQLQPKQFSFIPETGHDSSVRHIGFVAQDVQPILPEAVTSSQVTFKNLAIEDMLTVDITPALYAMINAIKELAVRVATLEGV